MRNKDSMYENLNKVPDTITDLILIKGSLEIHAFLFSSGLIKEILGDQYISFTPEEELILLSDLDRLIVMYDEVINKLREVEN